MADPTNDAPTRRPARALRAVGEPLREAGRAVRGVRLRRPRRGWRVAVAWLAAGLLASLVFGVTTASVQAGLGPHVTRYDVTTDKTITIDFGPLGTLQIDSPLPATLGVRATVQEIPASVTELGEARTLQALSEDVSAYVSFFSGPAAAVEDVARALVESAVLRSFAAFTVLLAAWCLVRWLLGQDRRDDLVGRLTTRAKPLRAAAVVVVVGATVLTSSLAPGDRPGSQEMASVVFAGTPLEGARVTGRLGGVIDTYGAYAVDAWRANEEFYRAADEALVVAWEDRQELEERRARQAAEQDAAERAGPLRPPTPDGPEGAADGSETDGSDTDGSETDGSAADTDGGVPPPDGTPGATTEPEAAAGAQDAPDDDASAPADRTSSVDEEPTVDPVVLVLVSDLHCNVGMAPVIGTLARLAGADAVLDAGDTTMNGTSVEQYCVTSFARAVPPGVELVTAPGNHDSRETSDHYARAGATVLDGSVVEVAGVRVLGDSDPSATRVGAGGTAAAADETTTQAGRRLADLACDDGEVDLLLVHSPTVGDAALEDGCVPAQVSGHYHRRIGPEQVGLGVRYVSSSTAGATLNQPTVGPLRGVAEMTVLRFDPVSRRIVELQVVQVGPDASVTVGAPRPWPVVVEPPDDAEDDAEGDVGDGDPDAGETDPDATAPAESSTPG